MLRFKRIFVWNVLTFRSILIYINSEMNIVIISMPEQDEKTVRRIKIRKRNCT